MMVIVLLVMPPLLHVNDGLFVTGKRKNIFVNIKISKEINN